MRQKELAASLILLCLVVPTVTADPSIPETLTVTIPAPSYGDQVEYQIHLAIENWTSDKTIRVSLERDAILVRGDGELVRTLVYRMPAAEHILHAHVNDGITDEDTTLYVAVDGQGVIAREHDGWQPPQDEETVVVGLPGEAREVPLSVEGRSIHFEKRVTGEPFMCGLRSDLQGKELAAGDEIQESMACQMRYVWADGGHDRSATLKVVDVFDADGARYAEVFDDAEGHLDATNVYTGRYLYQDGIAYPVRMQFHSPDASNNWSLSMELTGFTRGLRPVADAPLPQAPASLEWVERTPHGIGDDGLLHPFTLGEAYRLLQADPDHLLFLADHPESYVQAASFIQIHEPNLDPPQWHDVWRLTTSDGVQQQAFQVTRTWLAEALGEALAVDQVRSFDVEAADYEILQSALSDQVPTVQSLWDHQAVWRGGQTVGYGFRIECAGDCPDPIIRYWTGQDSQTTLDGTTWDRIYDVVQWGEGTTGLVPQTFVERLEPLFDHAEAIDPLPRPPLWKESASTENLESNGGQDPQPFQAQPWLMGASAAGLGAVALAAWAIKILGASLFSRTHSSTLLDDPKRREIFELIEAEPGIHVREVQRRVRGSNGQIMHHLGKLKAAGMVSAHSNGQRTLLFSQNFADARLRPGIAAAASDTAGEVLKILMRRSMASQADLARAVGVKPQTMQFHMDRLVQAGLVHKQKEGRACRFRLTHEGSRVAAAVTA